MTNYLKLMRVKHYIKNFLIFIPLIFSGLFFDLTSIFASLLGFISFCLASSIVYIINDIKDVENDRKHKMKKHRPIASGKVSIKNAIILAIFLFIFSILFNQLIKVGDIKTNYIYILIYIFMNVGYSLGLKNIPLLDITILVFGFLIRVLYGASIIGVYVSNWLYLTVISTSFYLSLGKRRNEIIKTGTKSRKVLEHYTQEFLSKNMYMCLAITIIFYSLWCVDPTTIQRTNELIIWTVPLVIIICMKYSMNIEKDGYGDPVDVVFSDKVLLYLIAVYAMIVIGIIYLPKIIV